MNRKDPGENQKKIRKIADRMLIPQSEWEMNIEHFDWVPGVGLYGLYRAYEATGEEKYLEFLEEWTKRHLQEAYIQKTVNSTAPLLSILCLYEKKKDSNLLRVCEEIAEDILRNAPRTVDGGLVQGVSTGTPVMPDREGYKRISLRPTLYGQGAAILALAEENADKKLERKEKEANGFYL